MPQTKRRHQQAGKSSKSRGPEPASQLSLAQQPQQPETPASTASQTNLLRVRIHDREKEERDRIASSIAAMIVKEIADLSALNLQAVARFIDLVKHDQGTITPAESLIADLVNDHYERDGITPEDVARQLDPKNTDGFRYNFYDALKSARRMRAAYPKLVA
jgi:hypothetical protein